MMFKINQFCYYAQSPGRGIGVFARKLVKENSLIIRDILKEIKGKDASTVESTTLRDHLFKSRGNENAVSAEKSLTLSLGASSILNHSDIPNCDIVWTVFEGIRCIQVHTNQTITKNSEFFIKYEDLERYQEHRFI